MIDSLVGDIDVDKARERISELLDQSLTTDEDILLTKEVARYQVIQERKTWDLSRINFEQLETEFKEAQYKNIEISDLKAFIEDKLEKMLKDNRTRVDFAERLKRIVDRYNAGGAATENYFEELVSFAKSMKEEDERHVQEGLTKDELELFDILKRKKMTKDEKQKIKLAAKNLLKRLVEEQPKILVQDWFKDSQTQMKVRAVIENLLDRDLPKAYEPVAFKQVRDRVYDLVYDYSSRGLKWAA